MQNNQFNTHLLKCLFSNYQLIMKQALVLVWGFNVEKDNQVSHIESFIIVVKDRLKSEKLHKQDNVLPLCIVQHLQGDVIVTGHILYIKCLVKACLKR